GAGQPAPPGAAPAGGAAAQPAGAQVTYEVNGSGKAGSITFGRGPAVAQATDAPLPWKQDSPAAQEPSDYTLAAVSGDGGEISCRILVGGAVIAEDSAKGDYAAVSCNGRR
ncbi:MAG: MmpS family protein, partial [Actinomycetota bacterium]|nr:MmpS family protein [Actinomycetota bacterium]